MTGQTDIDGGSAAVDIASGLVLSAICLICLVWLIPTYVNTEASGSDVAPAFFPNLGAGVVLVLSLGMVGHRVWRTKPAIDWAHGWRLGRPILTETAICIVAAIAIAVALPTIGFLPTAVAMIGIGGIVAGYRKWWALAVLAVAFPIVVMVGAWTIFTVALP